MREPRPYNSDPITVVDLFSGCGGFTQGFHEFRPAGATDGGPVFHSLAAVEHNRAAAATYAANFGSGRTDTSLPQARVHVGPIEEWEPTAAEFDADVVVGGPPCQGFSALNRGKKGAERNRLWEEYVRVVRTIRPKVFVIENVVDFVKSDEFLNLLGEVGEGGQLEDYVLVDPPGHRIGEKAEARNKRYVLNSADHGAVQARKRAIVIGVRRDAVQDRRMSYPVATHRQPPKSAKGSGVQAFDGLDDTVDHWRPVGSVFAESKKLPIRGTELPTREKRIAEIGSEIAGTFRTTELHIGRNPKPLSIARYKAIPPGGNRKDLRGKWFTVEESGDVRVFDVPNPPGVTTPVEYLSTESWDRHTNGTGDVMGRLRTSAPSVTIRTEFFKPEKGRYLHPTELRPITHYEAARIQGFPRTFRWCGSKNEIATQIGNAVPIPLGTAIASAIHTFLRG
ncbi:DNA cytosine methyltransferase [Streptomyces sp. NPDC051578]|uniref:DNA cytosine methyltransferase n=1 Tax=Streptomyces sp. NPDC051578 TaxID=3365662 RepID=UPI0037AE9FFB